MVFISTRSGNPDTWVKDLGTGKETPITITPLTEISPAISANGSRLAYGIREGQKVAIYGTPPTPGLHTGGFARLCEDCGQHVSWSPDGTKILYNRGEPSGVYSLDIFSGRSRLLVADPQYDLYEPYFSPDDRWITFNAATASRSRIFVALFSEGRPVPASEWIAIANGDPWDDNPRWSPDGNTLYFTTEGDGFRCISAQRLEPATKRPKGPPIAIYHSHHARLSLMNVDLRPQKISVARDKIVFTMSERTGNIWMAKLPGR
jgi:Tol biopolymer transport system component